MNLIADAEIKRFIHFADNYEVNDKYWKIRPVIKVLLLYSN